MTQPPAKLDLKVALFPDMAWLTVTYPACSVPWLSAQRSRSTLVTASWSTLVVFFLNLFFLNSMIVCWESKCPFNILDYEAFYIRVVGKSRPWVATINHAAAMPMQLSLLVLLPPLPLLLLHLLLLLPYISYPHATPASPAHEQWLIAASTGECAGSEQGTRF